MLPQGPSPILIHFSGKVSQKGIVFSLYHMDTAIELVTIATSYSVSKEGRQSAIIMSDLLDDLFCGDDLLSSTAKE